MNSPQFQEPPAPRRFPKTKPRHGRGHVYTPAEYAGALRRLDQIDRRCDGIERKCPAQATRELTHVPIDPQTGAETGPREVVKACSRHRQQWIRSGRFKLLGFKILGNGVDTETGLRVSGCYADPDGTAT